MRKNKLISCINIKVRYIYKFKCLEYNLKTND